MGTTASLFLEHIRSFAEPQTVPLRPLTLLVGENSSGKSSFLAVAACVFDPHRFPGRPAFNEPPFNLGTFETIATSRGGKHVRAESFRMGFSVGREGERRYQEVKATYRREKGSSALAHFEGKTALGRLVLEARGARLSGEVSHAANGASASHALAFSDSLEASQILNQVRLSSILFAGLQQSGLVGEAFRRGVDLASSLRSPFDGVVAFAPIRSRPRRTYDELAEDDSPEGDHVPRLLARLLSDEHHSETGKEVRKALQRFGEESGLFRQMEVKRLGKGPEDPFQVRVGVGGPKVNLMDVGYGVSQALPLIVQSVIHRQNRLLLMQQPEVHLHPRAQAALGTFFADLVAAGNDTLLIETHSDYLVDRVRQEVFRKKLKPEQVQILFFDKPAGETQIHPVELDESGNVVDAPEHYRDFFLQEELRLLRQAGA